MAEDSKVIKWNKVPHHPKWAGYMDGKHVATISTFEDVRVWIDFGRGFQRMSEPPSTDPKVLRALCADLLRGRLAWAQEAKPNG